MEYRRVNLREHPFLDRGWNLSGRLVVGMTNQSLHYYYTLLWSLIHEYTSIYQRCGTFESFRLFLRGNRASAVGCSVCLLRNGEQAREISVGHL